MNQIELCAHRPLSLKALTISLSNFISHTSISSPLFQSLSKIDFPMGESGATRANDAGGYYVDGVVDDYDAGGPSGA
ncbi:hypothetical protein VNO78_22924 [Psophocarpus tetragonolobus]|uniref:Uncharacterized protein n=1 Tax=Psophocarpus tetragonolobus TaxID=3891 RepID=A0AAN9S5L6_PSOTE